ncbi:MAG: 4-hydroxy-tetrahydrodipicolinate reductase [Endomicrobiia bacterium]|nr:4-hydroxy-tetrahydrodipicolinate reductase [Endomicrobiia bacterium]
MLNIAVAGVKGKMGSRILSLAEADATVGVAAVFEAASNAAVGSRIQFRGGQLSVGSDVADALAAADALIDFTSPAASLEHLDEAVAAKKAVVLGTTGFDDAGIRAIKSAAAVIPIVFSPNMSVGVNLLFKVVGEVARVLKDYDAEIVEIHHNQKKDAPSGTAAKLSEAITAACAAKNIIYGREGLVGARPKGELGVHAVRAGDIVGEHTVYFAGPGERVEITHRAHSRDCFASGAIAAAKWLAGHKPGLYTMRDVLGI